MYYIQWNNFFSFLFCRKVMLNMHNTDTMASSFVLPYERKHFWGKTDTAIRLPIAGKFNSKRTYSQKIQYLHLNLIFLSFDAQFFSAVTSNDFTRCSKCSFYLPVTRLLLFSARIELKHFTWNELMGMFVFVTIWNPTNVW